MTSAWVVRAGRYGEHERWNLEHGRATIGWEPIGNLSGCTTRSDVQHLVDGGYPENSPLSRSGYAGQLWNFRQAIVPGDLVVMPLKTQRGYVALGRCTGTYGYDAISEPNRRHFLPVEWRPEPVAKSAIKDDLLATLNGMMTVFSASKNNAAQRLESMWSTGVDPGNAANVQVTQHGWSEVGSGSVETPSVPTLDAIRDRIRVRIVENFGQHKLTWLVADILEALGYECHVSPPGPDQGIDIRAGRGPLALDAPTIVEVKSEPTAIGAPVLRGLSGAMTANHAEHGLLVAMGGITTAAAQEFRSQRTRIQVWDSEILLEKLFETYPRLSEATRAALPLKQAWVLDDESEG